MNENEKEKLLKEVEEKLHNQNYDIEIDDKTVYDDFDTFYNENQFTIFKRCVDLFHKMNEISDRNEFSLCIKYHDKEKDTIMLTSYNHDSINMLTEILLPYFEKIEEYEICSEIKNLFDDLNEKYHR